MVTGEFYMKKDLFPGFARPYVFNAKILLKYAGLYLVIAEYIYMYYCVDIVL